MLLSSLTLLVSLLQRRADRPPYGSHCRPLRWDPSAGTDGGPGQEWLRATRRRHQFAHVQGK